MAPSVRSAGARTRKAQPTLLGYSKIVKPTTVTRTRNGLKVSIENVEYVSKSIEEEKPSTPPANKRKRVYHVSEAEESDVEDVPVGKKVKACLPSPPSTDSSSRGSPAVSSSPCVCLGRFDRSPTPPPMPQGLQDLRELHKAFIKAFSFHRAHNGSAVPAELNELMQSMTRLYKKASVGKDDVQRMLAIYEVEEKTEIPAKASLIHTKGPFRLITSGVGSNRRNFVEFVISETDTTFLMPTAWDEEYLHTYFKTSLDLAFLYGRRNSLSFINGPISDYPLLAFAVGSQTAARQYKASALRKQVLDKSNQRQKSPELSNLRISDPNSPPKAIKARTLSLFERVKSKQAANSAILAPTSETIMRRHAIGRMGEIVEILKMKQQQKLNSELGWSGYTTPETPLRRVSFTMPELTRIVKGSLTTAISEEVLRTCIEILAKDAPGFWLRRLNMDGLSCVVLQGQGPVGTEIQSLLRAQEGEKHNESAF